MSNMKKITVVFGTRPEIIKLAPVINELRRLKRYNIEIVHTGQHLSLAEQHLSFFKIRPYLNLEIMVKNQDLDSLSRKLIRKMNAYFLESNSRLVIIQGDTASVFLTALVAYHHQIPVAHIEAGLRTNNLYSPFPEEGYRQMVSHLVRYNFCPTKNAAANLRTEGISQENIYIVGNTVVDALLTTARQIGITPFVKTIKRLSSGKKIIIVTLHRRENFGPRHESILKAIRQLSILLFDEIYIVFPVHPNPHISQPARKILHGLRNVYLSPPIGFLDISSLYKYASLIITDSGGIQEEAPSFGIPVLVTRELTERPEAVEAGCSFIVGSDPKKLTEHFLRLFTKRDLSIKSFYSNPYGDGKAAKRIVHILHQNLL
jgi:UDP-N-acetylglucosamine 2-epimerase (non-hydrolysing)